MRKQSEAESTPESQELLRIAEVIKKGTEAVISKAQRCIPIKTTLFYEVSVTIALQQNGGQSPLFFNPELGSSWVATSREELFNPAVIAPHIAKIVEAYQTEILAAKDVAFNIQFGKVKNPHL